jgi:hypothetical protein
MSGFGDDGREMPHDPTFDDGAIDAILAGQPHGNDFAALGSFVEDVRSAAEAVPTPSPALAAALASGISPQAPAPMPKWRKVSMKIKGFVAGLSVAGKIALGAGVACAATTGAGAAGVLPGPVQHAFSDAVSSVTPFEAPSGDHKSAEPEHDGSTTTTFHNNETPTTAHNGDGDHHDGDGSNKNGDGDGNGLIVTPTTRLENHDGDNSGDGGGDHESTPTTVRSGDGDGEHDTTPTTMQDGDGGGDNHDGGGDGEHSTTTTTVHHENEVPQTMTLNCERSKTPAPHISCSWTADPNPAHVRYLLLRSDGKLVYSGNDLSATDNDVVVSNYYSYVVISADSASNPFNTLGKSNHVGFVCCGD